MRGGEGGGGAKGGEELSGKGRWGGWGECRLS